VLFTGWFERNFFENLREFASTKTTIVDLSVGLMSCLHTFTILAFVFIPLLGRVVRSERKPSLIYTVWIYVLVILENFIEASREDNDSYAGRDTGANWLFKSFPYFTYACSFTEIFDECAKSRLEIFSLRNIMKALSKSSRRLVDERTTARSIQEPDSEYLH
jgi:hypothetical protein